MGYCSRLTSFHPASLADLHANQEFQRLLDGIVESEEQRLAVGRALLDMQLESNASRQEFAKTKFALEQRVLELEGEHAQELAYMVRPKRRLYAHAFGTLRWRQAYITLPDTLIRKM